jgi:outer membrane lipoprotein-sorting protein
MKSVKNLKQLIKKFHVTTNAKMDQKVKEDVLEVIRKFKKTQSALTQPNIWRIIMKSKITKLATAAVIIIAVVLGLNIISGPDMASVAWSKTVQPLMTARTMVFNVIMAEGENVPITRIMDNGTQRFRSEILSPDGKTILAIQIVDFDTLQILTLEPQHKTTLLTDLTDLPEKPENILEEMRNVITDIEENPAFSVELLGEQELDGQITTVVRATGPDGEFKIWADPQTYLPIRIEQKWRQTEFALTNFECDVELDESLFSMEIPEGYSEDQLSRT